MITIMVGVCLVILLLGAAVGAFVFGIASIGTLLALGFEIGLFLMPIILIYLIARWVWRITTDKKKPVKEEQAE